MEGKKGWKRTILKATAGNIWQISSVYNRPWWEKHAINYISTLKESIERWISIIFERHEPIYGYAKKSMPPPNNRNSDSNDSWIPAQLFGEAGIGQFFTNWNMKKL